MTCFYWTVSWMHSNPVFYSKTEGKFMSVYTWKLCGECVCWAPVIIADLGLLGYQWPIDVPIALPARSVCTLTGLGARRDSAGLETVEKTILSLMKVQPKFVSCPGSIIVTSLAVFPVAILRGVFSAAKIRNPGVQHVIRHFNIMSIELHCY